MCTVITAGTEKDHPIPQSHNPDTTAEHHPSLYTTLTALDYVQLHLHGEGSSATASRGDVVQSLAER